MYTFLNALSPKNFILFRAFAQKCGEANRLTKQCVAGDAFFR